MWLLLEYCTSMQKGVAEYIWFIWGIWGYEVLAGVYTFFFSFFSSLFSAQFFKYTGSQLIYWCPYSILYLGDFNSFCGMYTKVLPASASLQHWTMLFFYRFPFCSFPASFNRLVSVYQLDANRNFHVARHHENYCTAKITETQNW